MLVCVLEMMMVETMRAMRMALQMELSMGLKTEKM